MKMPPLYPKASFPTNKFRNMNTGHWDKSAYFSSSSDSTTVKCCQNIFTYSYSAQEELSNDIQIMPPLENIRSSMASWFTVQFPSKPETAWLGF